MNTFVHTLDLLNAIQVALLAIQLPSQFSTVPGYPTAFTADGVKIYGNENLMKAFADMLVFEDRACFIIPGGDDHDHAVAGAALSVKRTSTVHLLIADRNYGRENLALVGEAGSNPGTLALKDLVIDKLTGPSLTGAAVKHVLLAPASGDPVRITGKEAEDQPGRDCWAQSFTTYAGVARVPIPR